MDFRGWNSSYTGDPIPLDEMLEWRSATVDRIMALRPRRVLEIGVGSGLLLSQIAPRCEQYVATDMSAVAIDELAPVAGAIQIPWRDRVQLLAQPAHVTEGLPRGHFDTIIVNSIVQYFPNAGYLAEVIDNAMELLAPGGAMFIGDVRNHSLQGAFQTAVALAGTPAADTAEIRQRVHRAHAQRARITAWPQSFSPPGPPASRRWPDSTSKSNAARPTTNSTGTATTSSSTRPPHRYGRWPPHPAGRGANVRASVGCIPGWPANVPPSCASPTSPAPDWSPT